MITLIGGTIASGKSTISRAVAAELRRRGVPARVVDVDIVYEILEPRGASAGDPAVWTQARRLAGRMAGALLGSGAGVVLIEGGFLEPSEREEIGAVDDLVILRASLPTALRRVRSDESRGISRDEAFLGRHYAQAEPLLERVPADALVLDTDELPVAGAAAAIAERLLAPAG